MISRTFLWLASIPLLAVLIVHSQPRSSLTQDDPDFAPKQPISAGSFLQASTETPGPELLPTPTAARARRATPTPLPPLPPKRNPGLVVGALIVVAIILIGVLRFTRKK